jgi:hypothetical protein
MAIPDFFKPQKAPADHLPYGFDWTKWLARNALESAALAGDVVVSASITATPSGLTIGSTGIDDAGKVVSAMISGGVDQTDYTLICTVSTQAGLQAVAEETLQVRANAR